MNAPLVGISQQVIPSFLVSVEHPYPMLFEDRAYKAYVLSCGDDSPRSLKRSAEVLPIHGWDDDITYFEYCADQIEYGQPAKLLEATARQKGNVCFATVIEAIARSVRLDDMLAGVHARSANLYASDISMMVSAAGLATWYLRGFAIPDIIWMKDSS